jgi:hypothetical protein
MAAPVNRLAETPDNRAELIEQLRTDEQYLKALLCIHREGPIPPEIGRMCGHHAVRMAMAWLTPYEIHYVKQLSAIQECQGR